MYPPSTREGPWKFPRQPVVLHITYVNAPYVEMLYIMPVVCIQILGGHLVEIGRHIANFNISLLMFTKESEY